MSKPLTKEDIAKMTQEEKEDLASRMYNPVRCGGCDYDDEGRPWYVHGGIRRSPEEHNDIIRAANPKWSEEALKPHLLPTKADQLTSAAHSTLVFLLLSLEAAPEKADDLLRLASTHQQEVKAYQAALMRLYHALAKKKLAEVCATMREELRRS